MVRFGSKLIQLIVIFLWISKAYSQVVYTDNPFPKESDPLVVYFNAAEGNKGLMAYSGDVYAHTGVITQNSSGLSDWRYVKSGWGQNTADTKLVRVSTDLYKLELSPDIRAYYGMAIGDQAIKLAFVFRSAIQVNGVWKEGKTSSGGDLFIDLFNDDGAFKVKIQSPTERTFIAQAGQQFEIKGYSSKVASLKLYRNNAIIAEVAEDNKLLYAETIGSSGDYKYNLVGTHISGIKDSSIFYCTVPSTPSLQPLPINTPLGLSRLSENSARIRLSAPGKNNVFIIGSFNDYYLSNNYQMKKTPDGNDFWIDLTGLYKDSIYSYQFLVDGQIRIADPLSTGVLDPANDKFITNGSNYTNLYPTQKTTGIVSFFNLESTPFNWQVNNFVIAPNNKLFIYEALVRDFSSDKSFLSIIDRLDYLKDLGVNVLQLMPINEFEGNNSWGYNPSFHMALDKFYGSKNQFKELVDKCHQKGIAVVLDVVFNHAFSQSPLCQLNWDAANFRPATNNPWLNPEAKHPYNVGYDFNHESKFTQDYMDRVLEYWIKEYKIDGFRFDLSKGFTQKYNSDVGLWGQYDASRISILRRLYNSTIQHNSKLIMILEHFADNVEERELSGLGYLLWENGNNDYIEAAMGYNGNLNFHNYKQRGFSTPSLVSYMESHDEERMAFKIKNFGSISGIYNTRTLPTLIERTEMSFLMFLLTPGPKMIWQFGELAFDYSINTCENLTISNDCRLSPKPVRWDYFSDNQRMKLYHFVADLARLKSTFPIFSQGEFDYSLESKGKQIRWTYPDMNAIATANFDVAAISIPIRFSHTGLWYDFISGDSIEVTELDQIITFDPGEYHLYTDKRTFPRTLTTGTNEIYQNEEINIFPNPSNQQLIFNIGKEKYIGQGILNILGSDGKVLVDRKIELNCGYYKYDCTNLSVGTYFMSIIVGTTRFSGRFIKQ